MARLLPENVWLCETMTGNVEALAISVCTLTHTHRQLVTCGHDCDVRVFAGIEEDDCSEFSVASDKISALVCYQRNGKDLVAIATDDNTVQAFTCDVRLWL